MLTKYCILMVAIVLAPHLNASLNNQEFNIAIQNMIESRKDDRLNYEQEVLKMYTSDDIFKKNNNLNVKVSIGAITLGGLFFSIRFLDSNPKILGYLSSILCGLITLTGVSVLLYQQYQTVKNLAPYITFDADGITVQGQSKITWNCIYNAYIQNHHFVSKEGRALLSSPELNICDNNNTILLKIPYNQSLFNFDTLIWVFSLFIKKFNDHIKLPLEEKMNKIDQVFTRMNPGSQKSQDDKDRAL